MPAFIEHLTGVFPQSHLPMRVAESLTIPTELERARSAGELVVFAGAGVSMGPPANLPGFMGLARQIAEPKIPWDPTYEKALDRYLGRAAREGVKVQDRAQTFLNTGGSHTPLHEHLLGIFGTPDRVRLITTNFDPHFSTAAASVFPGALLPRYVGPALPPGRNFSGIAQLHGALDHPQDSLVLTDADFAEAYMAEGWAARFLVRVFAERTVLFVGYSLTDPLMQYLLHALPPTGRWYGLWHESEVTQGAEHSIIPVLFRTTASGDRYGDLNDGMQRWHWYVSAPASDHDKELRRLISLGPPASPLDEDYVRARLSTEAGRGVFWAAATDLRWFEWAAAEGLLDGLTDGRGTDPAIPTWGHWSLKNFCNGEHPPLLRFLRGRPLTIQLWFLAELIRHLWLAEPLPPRPVLRQLVAIIASQLGSSVGDPLDWQWLLERLVREHCYDEALLLLRTATRVHLQPIDRLYLKLEEGEEPSLPPLSNRVGTLVSSAQLADLLEKHGSDLAAWSPDRLLMLGEQRIEEAYELLDAASGATGNMDWLSFGRTSISPSDQDSFAHAEDALIALIRTVLDHLSVVAPDRLQSFTERHERSERNLFRRLALYAYAQFSERFSDEVLERATVQGWARDLWVRPELYLVLGAHYRQATESAKKRFITALQDDSWWGPTFDEHSAHARYSLSQKLLREAPDSRVTRSFAAAETRTHPEWREGDQDGFLSRIETGWGIEEPSPIEPDQMLEWAPAKALEHLISVLQEEVAKEQGYAVLGAIQHAVRSSPAWGAGLLRLTLNADPAHQRIAEATLWGLKEASPNLLEKLEFLRVFVADGWAQRLTGAIASLVEKWSGGLGQTANPALLDGLDAAADLVYDRSSAERPGIEDHGWTESAINHPAGNAATVWWRVANARDWIDGQFVLSLDGEEKNRWERVIRDETSAGAFARPILGMATDRLSTGDFPWASDAIFPAFDPKQERERAAQLWDGRLMQRQWSWATVEVLQPYFDEFFSVTASLIPARSQQLGDWVAMLVADVERSGLTLARLERFVQYASDEARRAFADTLPRHLERLEPDARRKLWRDILLPYWRDRRTNMPVPLAPEEVREMISWVPALSEVAGEAVAELMDSPGDKLDHADQVIWEWRENDTWVRAHPTEATALVEFLGVRHSINPWLADDAVTILEQALEAGALHGRVLSAAESLVAVSPQRAVALVARLRSS